MGTFLLRAISPGSKGAPKTSGSHSAEKQPTAFHPGQNYNTNGHHSLRATPSILITTALQRHNNLELSVPSAVLNTRAC